MIERITKNEERLNNAIIAIKDLEVALINFKKQKKDISLLKKYYGSKTWFSDLSNYEKNNIKIKAGVLSEDGIWNMLDDLDNLVKEMKIIVNEYKK